MSPGRLVEPVRTGPSAGGGVAGSVGVELEPPVTSCVAPRGLTVKLVRRSAFPARSRATSV